MSLLDPKWKYTHSTATDIRKTFAKARKAMAKKKEVEARTPKLQLMCAPSEAAAPGARPKTSLYSARSDGSLDQGHEDRWAPRRMA